MIHKRNCSQPQGTDVMTKLWTAVLIETVLIIFLFGGIATQHRELQKKKEQILVAENISSKIDLSILTKEIRAIGELATAEYLYTDAGEFSDNMKIQEVDIPLTTKSFLIKWDGIVKAGIDVTEIAVNTDENAKTITIRIPQAKILTHEIDRDSLETIDEHNNIFNNISVDDVNSFLNESKKDMEKRAIENGVLEQATENARALIMKFMESNDVIQKHYTVNISTIGQTGTE